MIVAHMKIVPAFDAFKFEGECKNTTPKKI
jgi:hypothetical protein